MAKSFTIIHIKDGILQNRKAVKILFDSLKDGRHKLEVTEINKRSLNQNAYYWLILTEYIQPALYNEGWSDIKTKEDAHVFVSDIFLKRKSVNEATGEIKELPISTTELTKADFNIYLNDIWRWAAEYLSINIPEPNQQTIFNYD